MRIKFCFIVLHYLEGSIQDTIECVDSLFQNIERDDYAVVIVDNGSNDTSLETLTTTFLENNKVEVLHSEHNLGFARGNNMGSSYALSRYSPDFLLVINNDTYLTQPQFLSLIETEYEKCAFGVLGPYIYDRNSKPQNPVQIKGSLTVEDVEKRIQSFIENRARKETVRYRAQQTLKATLKKCHWIRLFAEKRYNKKAARKRLYDPDVAQFNVPLHGSALIFSRRYFELENQIFFPETFLYREEEILFYMCMRDGIIIRYQPAIKIHHKEDVSSDAAFVNSEKKLLFKYEQQMQSYMLFRELIIRDKGTGVLR